MYCVEDIKHETTHFWVCDVGSKGFEVNRKGITHSVRVASIGRASTPNSPLGLPRAIEECNRRQAAHDAKFVGRPEHERRAPIFA